MRNKNILSDLKKLGDHQADHLLVSDATEASQGYGQFKKRSCKFIIDRFQPSPLPGKNYENSLPIISTE